MRTVPIVGALAVLIALIDPGASSSAVLSAPTAMTAPSTAATHAPASAAAASADVIVVNGLLLGQEFSLFYGGFDY
jgi:hypothetical protein